MSEHDEQKALFEWAERMIAQGRIPELVNMFAIPNGAWMRNKAIAMKQKEEGLKKGVPDIFLAVPNNECGYHGLFIEMKFGKNKETPEQIVWSAQLRSFGYFSITCQSWCHAARCIVLYLGRDAKLFPELSR
ncbi:MAG: VRR-NUC domain-containing protein [Anaerolineaceae bacterium]